jgi:hypothetical protein
MTDRRAGEGFSVAPQRIGGGRSGGRGPWRGRPLKAVVVLVACLSIVGVAFLGPRLSGKPNFDIAFFATPVPSTTPKASETAPPLFFGPTPLPEITRTDGGTLTGQVAVWADSMRVLDLGSGTVEGSVYANFGRDVLVADPDGAGWLCICMTDTGGDGVTGVTTDVQVIRISADGTEIGRTTVTTLGDAKDPTSTNPVQTDFDLAPDGRAGLMSFGVQRGTAWEYSVARLDLVEGTIGPSVVIGSQVAPPVPASSATPNPDNPGTYTNAAGPYIRRSPDGSQAFVWSQIQQVSNDTLTFTENRGWRVPLDAAGDPQEPRVAPAFGKLPEWCPTTGYVRPDRLVMTCFLFPTDASPDQKMGVRFIEVGIDGTAAKQADLPAPQNFFSEPLFDTANGVVWLWDPYGLTLVRVDTEDFSSTSTTFDPLVARSPGLRSFAGARPVWDHAGSSVGLYGGGQIAGAPDGSRLYLIGFQRDVQPNAAGQASLGVFVVDPATLALVDRWAPAAAYSSIETVLDGRLVALSGMPGMDADGRGAPWQGSITLHDATDGRILLRFGRIGDGSPPIVLRR